MRKYFLFFLSLVLIGCGGNSGFFEKINVPQSSTVDGISGGDGYTAPIRQDYTQAYQDAAYDILWVLDNSGSMADEIAYVRDNVGYFAQTMEARRSIQYQMAVVNTDWRDTVKGHGTFRGSVPTISYSHADPVAEFQNAVDDINYCAGSGGGCATSGNEMGLNAARQALNDHSSFMRNGANLFVIVVSDENDVSCTPNAGSTACQGGGNGSLAAVSVFTSYFSGVKASGTGSVSFYPVVGISNDTGCTFASLGTRYLQLLTALGTDAGESGSICQSEMVNSVNRIANTIADNGLCFTLAYTPNATTIDVYLDNVLVTSGYALDKTKNAICFDVNHIPQNGQRIGVEYYRP